MLLISGHVLLCGDRGCQRTGALEAAVRSGDDMFVWTLCALSGGRPETHRRLSRVQVSHRLHGGQSICFYSRLKISRDS